MNIAEPIDGIVDRLVIPSFSRVGYEYRRRLFKWGTPQVRGKRIAITGPTGGIGNATAAVLAQNGAELTLIARNPAKMAKVAEELSKLGPAPSTIVADLSDLDSVRAAGRKLADGHLDALIHNGGGLHNKRSETGDGLELTFATHVVAPFLLTSTALPALKRAKPGRVITVSSGGMYTQGLDLDDLQSTANYSGSTAYAQAKRAQVTLNELSAERFDSSNIAFHAMHPGWAATPGLAEALPHFYGIMKPFLRTATQAADTIVWLCGADPDEVGSGGFWLDRRRRPTEYRPGTAASAEQAVTLWNAVAGFASIDPVTGEPETSS